jgi:hypothetical protein
MSTDIQDIQVEITPESLADLVEDLYSKGLDERQVNDEVERIKQEILANIKERIANGDDFLSELEDAPVRYIQ